SSCLEGEGAFRFLALCWIPSFDGGVLARRFQKFGLRGLLFGVFTGAQAALFLVLAYVVADSVQTFLNSRLVVHGRSKAQELARGIASGGLELQAGDPLRSFLEPVQWDETFKFVAILDRDGQRVTAVGELPTDFDSIVSRTRQAGMPPLVELE